jgi:hypothetical protein
MLDFQGGACGAAVIDRLDALGPVVLIIILRDVPPPQLTGSTLSAELRSI